MLNARKFFSINSSVLKEWHYFRIWRVFRLFLICAVSKLQEKTVLKTVSFKFIKQFKVSFYKFFRKFVSIEIYLNQDCLEDYYYNLLTVLIWDQRGNLSANRSLNNEIFLFETRV